MFSTPSAEKPVIIIAGPGIGVDNNSDADSWRFTISTSEITPLTVQLTLVAKVSGETQSLPVLKGTVIDEIELSWEYNQEVSTQSLENSGELTEPDLDDETSYEYTAQSIDEDISFTIEGNTGLGGSGAVASDTKSVQFGNYMFLGHGTSKIGTSAASLEAFIEGLSTKVIKTSRGHTYFATGGAGQKHFVAYEKSLGLGVFKKSTSPGPGGYVRLKNVAGVLKVELTDEDVETDITFTNEAGHEASYYIYESLFDFQDDDVNPFTIT